MTEKTLDELSRPPEVLTDCRETNPCFSGQRVDAAPSQLSPICLEQQRIQEYIRRCRKLTPAQRLEAMGRLRDFIYRHMTPEGKRFFEQTRNGAATESAAPTGKWD